MLTGLLHEFLSTPARQGASLRETAHRPWPLPTTSWIQGQTWENLLFAHWPVPEEALRPLVPGVFPIDTWDGSAWVGITPFRVTGFRLRGFPPAPRLSSFLELNVRTYVTVDGKPGIFFLSLDAESKLAVEGARRSYRLPYYHARITATRRGDWIDYSSARRDEASARPFVFKASYRPIGEARPPEPGSLEHFVTERYCLYTLDERQDPARANIHHPPWPLQEAEAEIELNTMAPNGLDLAGEPALLHFSARQDTVIWPLEAVAPTPSS